MISSDVLWGIAATFLIQAGMVAYGYGKLTQRVSDLSRKLDNGWTCGQHLNHAERITKLEATQDALSERIDAKVSNPFHKPESV